MLMPKKVKYRKQQRGRMTGKAWRGSTLARRRAAEARSSAARASFCDAWLPSSVSLLEYRMTRDTLNTVAASTATATASSQTWTARSL